MNFYYSYNPILIIKTSDNGESERQETLIGKVQKFCFPPLPTGFSLNIGLKEPPYEERKRYYRNSSSVSQVSAVQAQTSASCCRTPSDCSDRILRHCDRFKNSSNRVPVHKTVMGKKKTLTPSAAWHKGFYILFGLRLQNMSKTSHHDRLVTVQRYSENLKHARNVNFVLTFRVNICNSGFRRIAAMFKSLIYNYIRINDICKNANTIVVLNVVGSSPTVHPTRKSYDYQLVMGFRVSIIIPIPP